MYHSFQPSMLNIKVGSIYLFNFFEQGECLSRRKLHIPYVFTENADHGVESLVSSIIFKNCRGFKDLTICSPFMMEASVPR